MLEHFIFKDPNTYCKSKYLIFPFISIFSSRLFFLKLSFYWDYTFVVTKGHSSIDEPRLVSLQGRIQPNYLLLGKDTFHPHIGTLSSKTKLLL